MISVNEDRMWSAAISFTSLLHAAQRVARWRDGGVLHGEVSAGPGTSIRITTEPRARGGRKKYPDGKRAPLGSGAFEILLTQTGSRLYVVCSRSRTAFPRKKAAV